MKIGWNVLVRQFRLQQAECEETALRESSGLPGWQNFVIFDGRSNKYNPLESFSRFIQG